MDAADKFGVWVSLRDPNPLSEKYIGNGSFVPKGMLVKGKSADNPAHPLAGLVVDPMLCPEAFLPTSIFRATQTWLRWWCSKPGNIQVIPTGSMKGMVVQDGKGIYADYDLLALQWADSSTGDFQYTYSSAKDPGSWAIELLYRHVQLYLNGRFGLELVQHGPEFDVTFDGVGSKEGELLHFFGPHRQYRFGRSGLRPRHLAH